MLEELRRLLIEEFFLSAWTDALGWFGAVWVIVVLIRKASKDADDELDPERRKSLAEDLARIRHRQPGSWIPDFTLVFDRFFGEKHLRWRCVYRSSLISIFCFSMLTFLWDASLIWFSPIGQVVFFVLLSIPFNAFLDYWSLLETRILLKTPLTLSLKMLVDAVLTFLMALGWLSLFWMVSLDTDIGYPEAVRRTWEALAGRSMTDPTVLRIVVATSFTTSIWLWLHGLAQVTIRVLSTAGWFMGWLNIKEKPLRAIGTTINVFVLLLGVVLFPVFLAVK